MKKLVAVMTCHKRRAWADVQRQTWAHDIRAQGYADVVFFVGTIGVRNTLLCRKLSDEVWLDVDDSYAGIPLKVQGICKYAGEHGYDFVAKCDDDVYVVPERFATLPMYGDYIGRFRSPYGKTYPVRFASGFFYWLSRRAAQLVAEQPWNGDWQDERFVASVLAHHGIVGHMDAINYLVTGPHFDSQQILTRDILKNGTVYCEYGPDAMRELHQGIHHLRSVCGHPGMMRQELGSVTARILNSPPDDKAPANKTETYNANVR